MREKMEMEQNFMSSTNSWRLPVVHRLFHSMILLIDQLMSLFILNGTQKRTGLGGTHFPILGLLGFGRIGLLSFRLLFLIGRGGCGSPLRIFCRAWCRCWRRLRPLAALGLLRLLLGGRVLIPLPLIRLLLILLVLRLL